VENKSLALFDFDGTITRKDTFLEFIKFTHGNLKFWFGMWLMSPLLILFKIKIIPNNKAKTFVLKYFYGGWPYEKFKKAGEDFCEQKLPALIKPSALEQVKHHIKENHRVILVTASAMEWVAPWANKIGIEIISSQLEVKDEKITGRLGCPNCYGQEKVNRLKNVLVLEDYPAIYAYGDSSGDKQMLAASHHPHYRHFND